MAKLSKTIAAMRNNPKNVHYDDLFGVCCQCFGQPRQRSGSHAVFRTPWHGDPRINIQNSQGMAKPYQVRQVLLAIDKLCGQG